MSGRDFYPYRAKPGVLNLALHCQNADLPCSSGGIWQAYAEDLPDSIEMSAAVTVPDEISADTIIPEEQADSMSKIMLVLRSIESRYRDSISLKWDGDANYTGEIEFTRREWTGAVEIQALLVRTTDNDSLPSDFASDTGAILSSSEPQRILFDEPRLLGDYLEIRWKRFSEGEEWLRRQAANLFAIDILQLRPVLLLNSEIPNAVAILDNNSNTGRGARIRDIIFRTIVHQVWSSLLSITLAELSKYIGFTADETDESPLEQLQPWQKRILEDWAPKLYSDGEPTDALSRLINAMQETSSSFELLAVRIPEAIQRDYDTVQAFQGLVREVGY